MTREKAMEIKNLVEGNGGKINQEGYIIGGNSIWTSLIEDIIEREGRIFYCRTEKKMRISDWPKHLDDELMEVVKFKGFHGEDMELKIRRTYVEPELRDHDHVEIWRNGEPLKYLHIYGEGNVDAY